MKRTVLLMVMAVLVSFGSTALAGQGLSKLELRLWDKSKFFVELDNHSYPATVRTFRMDNLAPGQHYIRVIKSIRRHNGFMNQVVFRGYIQIPASSKVTARITKNHIFDIIKIRRIGQNNGYGYNAYGNTGINSYGITTSCGYSVVMSDNTFRHLKSMVSNGVFDSKKMDIIKVAIASSRVSSRQVLELMRMLMFDSNRLELAKFAYLHTVDKQNYFIVNDAFIFSSNISALSRYIGSLGI